MKRSYLEHIKIVSFGAFSNKAVGPFAPHLNVVYGPNEAGKTTLASFVGGVLFGWEEARGSRNTYKPANAERSGSLFFAPCHLERIGEDSPSVILGGGGEAAAVEGSSVASADYAQGLVELELSRVRNSELAARRRIPRGRHRQRDISDDVLPDQRRAADAAQHHRRYG